MRWNLLAPALLAGALAAVGGCQTVGPHAIGIGRDRYNSVLHSTSMEQTMSNIVRAYNYEPPMFMDVTEVDAVLSVGASVMGGATNVGARPGVMGGTEAGMVGNASGSVQYSETPTIRYQPLLGQALVAQLVTPVTVDALGEMYDSYWDVGALLDLSSAYLTLDYREFYPALNTIIELNHREALELAAGKAATAGAILSAGPSPGPAAIPGALTQSMMGPPKNDALVIYLRPFHRGAGSADLAEKQRVLQLWVRMFRIYGDSQPPFSPPAECRKLGLSMDKNSLRDWDVNIAKHVSGPEDQQNAQLNAARDCLPNAIELRVQPLPPLPDGGPGAGNLVYQAPVMRTYSALGILKNATERQNPRIEFVTPQIYNQIRGDRWNDDADSSSYYTLLPSELDSVNCSEERRRRGGCETPPIPSSERDMFNSQIDRWIRNFATGGPTYPSGLDVYEASGSDVLDPQFINMNGRLGTLRRYVLIIVDDRLPKSRAYASYFDGSKWYYIDKDDTVSEKNFQLLALFMTMMAVPPSTPPLSPTINVGG